MVALYSVYTGTNMLVAVSKFDTLKAPSIFDVCPDLQGDITLCYWLRMFTIIYNNF